MKLDRLKLAKVVAHCCNNGFSTGDWEIERLDELIEFEVEQPKAGVVSCEAVDNLLMLMAEGTRKIESIKTYHILTGAGLRESRDAVERYWVSK
jgi:ribosomal protein L7/L12